MNTLTPRNYLEISWIFVSMLLGSMLNDAYWGGAIIFLLGLTGIIASPIILNRFLLASKFNSGQTGLITALYVIAMAVWCAFLAMEYAAGQSLIPVAPALFYVLLRWISLPSSD